MTNATLPHSTDHDGRAADSRRGRWPRQSRRRFIRHYFEMVVVMFAGMAVLGAPAGWALGAAGSSWSELTDTSPALMLLLMATTMTVPMVAWMRYRGHGWRANTEMAASMVLPTLAAIGLLAADVATVGTLLVGEHIAMLLGMLAAMLLRPDEYTHHHGHGQVTVHPQSATA
jgi:hypothetical protein